MLTFLIVSLNGQELFPKKNKKGEWGYIDEKGNIIITYMYRHARDFSEELAAVYLDKWWGFINKKGRHIIPCQYQQVNCFSEGLAAVRRKDKWGFIDKTGKIVIPFDFQQAESFSDGLSTVLRNGKWGCIDKNGKDVITFIYSSNLEVNMSANVVKERERLKQEKKETERIAALRAEEERKEEEKRKKKEEERIAAAKAKAEKEEAERIAALKAEEERKEAERLAAIKTEEERKEEERLAAIKTQTAHTSSQNVTTPNLTVVKSDVAVNIPTTGAKNDKTLALIIANEDYQYVASVEFAKNDGEVFRKYCIQTLGISEKNIKFITNATQRNIRREVQLTCQIAETYNGEASIIFYYAGHGVPDQKSETAYLLPVDGESNDLEASGYKLDDLYQEFGKINAQKIVVILDACFSGTQRGGEMLASARGVKIKPKPSMPSGNTVVFSATYADESAYPYREQGHGLFTYFILKKLQESKGNVTLGELYDYVSQNVRREALRVNRNNQTPTITPSAIMENNWKNKKLK